MIMILKLIRDTASPSFGGACAVGEVGHLYVDGVLFCATLERRGVEILALWYTVSVTMSPRFKRLLPIVNDVPGRSGIRFHVGTRPEHSAGCILVPSRETEKRLTETLLKAQRKHETIYLEICDPKNPAPLYGTPCPAHERMRYREAERIREEYYRQHPDELPKAG